jgi:hypothetical protein
VDDTDWSLSKIAQKLRGTEQFFELSPTKRKELSAKNIEDFFTKNAMYKSSVYHDPHRKAHLLRGWRLKAVELEEGY